MAKRKGKARLVWWTLVAIVVLVLLPWPAAYLFPWTRINCTEQDLSLDTAKARTTKYYWFIPYHRQTMETPLSEMLVDVASPENEVWVRVNTFSPGSGHSPHHFYHGAYFQMGHFARIVGGEEWSASARRTAAQEMLRAWKEGGNYHAGGQYIEQLIEFTVERDMSTTGQATISTDDVPRFDPQRKPRS
jgi:hypothetical protein